MLEIARLHTARGPQRHHGHQGVLVDGPGGLSVMIGDAASTTDIYRQVDKADLSRWRGQHANRREWARSLKKVHAMHPHAVHLCHDTEVLGSA